MADGKDSGRHEMQANPATLGLKTWPSCATVFNGGKIFSCGVVSMSETLVA
jgi:hypothetical protein